VSERRRLRLGFVGAGWVAENAYAPGLAADSRLAATCVLDPDARRAARFAGLTGAVPVADFDAVLCAADAVVVCTPPDEHATAVRRAVAARKHVLCEKPVARRVAELELGPHADALLMASASIRLRTDVAQLLRWIADGRLGAVRRARLWWVRGAGVPAPGSWRTDPRHAPLGVLEDLGPHLLDIVAALVADDEAELAECELDCRFGGQPRAAGWFAAGTESTYVVPDVAHARIVTGRGIDIDVRAAWADGGAGDTAGIIVEGEHGRAECRGLFGFSTERREPEQLCRRAVEGKPVEARGFEPGPGLQIDAFRRMLRVFADFAAGLRPACAGAVDARRVAGWLEAAAARASFAEAVG
jgi:predicted dehydrogenase